MTDYIGNGEKLIIGIICELLGEKYEAVHDSRNQNHNKAEILYACKTGSDIVKRTPAYNAPYKVTPSTQILLIDVNEKKE